jgi:hypothetical protein
MNKLIAALLASLVVVATPARADDNAAVVDVLSGYLDFA